ncbi:MAG: hypothetical protein H6500_01745 [Candidatus Woesearchaeota archaeon]|nr:MAG: hypothetical protein H6500_01745 [Candidatus Woesearchaeota archaeon]
MGALVFLFLLILFLSSAGHVKAQYEFSDSSEEEMSSYISIGKVTLTNDGLLPARAHLKTYIACPVGVTQTYGESIMYRGEKRVGDYSSDPFGSYIGNQVDLDSKETLVLTMVVSLFPSSSDEPQSLAYSLYEVDGNDRYSFDCSNPNGYEVFQTITITFLPRESVLIK